MVTTGPFRLIPGPAGDLSIYSSETTPGAPVRGHVILCHDLPRPVGRSAADVALTYPALADRLTPASRGWRVVTAALRGSGESAGDFSPSGWLDDLVFVAETEIPADATRVAVGFGFGGVLALRLAAEDERISGAACLGSPADLAGLAVIRPLSWTAADEREWSRRRGFRSRSTPGPRSSRCCTRSKTWSGRRAGPSW